MQPSTPEPTGFEGGAANVAYIASKFLDGIKQHRAQRFALEQMEEEKARRGYETAIKAIESNQGLTPLKKQELMAPLIQGLIGQAAGVKEGSKHTGNGLTDLAKNMFVNMAGGELPSKGQKLDMGLVGNVFAQMDNNKYPENFVTTHLTRGNQAIQQMISSMGDDATQEKILNNPQFQELVGQTRNATGIADWTPDFSYLPKNEVDRIQRQALLSKASAEKSIYESIPTTQNAPQQSGNEAQTPIDRIRQIARSESSKNALVPYYKPSVSIGQSKVYVDKFGNVFQGHNVESATPEFQSGIYKGEKEGNIVPDAREARASDINTTINRTVATLGKHLKNLTLPDGTPIELDGNNNPIEDDQLYQQAIRGGRVVNLYPVDPNLRNVDVKNPDGSIEIYAWNPRTNIWSRTGKASARTTGTTTQTGAFPDNPNVQVVVRTPSNIQPPPLQETGPSPSATPQTVTPPAQAGAPTTVNPAATAPPPGAPRPTQTNKNPANRTGRGPGLIPMGKAYSERTKSQLNALKNTEDLVTDLNNLLKQKDPSTGKPYYENNSFSDAFKTRYNNALYKRLGIKPSDWSEAINQLSSLESIQGASGYMSGNSAYALLQEIQQHLAMPTDTPALMYSKVQRLSDLIPKVRFNIEETESGRYTPGVGPIRPNAPNGNQNPSPNNSKGFGSNPFQAKKPAPVGWSN
jgi:hypothetical protein